MRTINRYLAESISRRADEALLIEHATREQVTYRSFDANLGRVSKVLTDYGVTRGDRVTLICRNSIDLATMLYGVMAYGAIACPLNPQLTQPEIANIVEHAGSKVIFVEESVSVDCRTAPVIDIRAYRGESPPGAGKALFGPVDETTGAMLIYTSGTTGVPKGILLNHRNIVHNTTTAIKTFSLDSNHTTACVLPLFHMFAFISDLSTMAFCGGKVVIQEVFDISRMVALQAAVEEHQVNSFSAVPLIFELLLKFGCELKAPPMKFCVSGAAPLKEKTAVEFRDRYGFNIIPAYGLTESTCFATICPPDRIDNRSVGMPADLKIKTVSDENRDLGPNEIGELVIRGESVMEQGYFRGAADCFLDAEKRWFKTGDLGFYDEAGYFYITGRKKNMVIRGGEKIYLEDVDACLNGWEAISDSATVSYDQDGEERIACFVVAGEGLQSDAEIRSYIRARMGDFKCPDVIVFRDRIPRTPTNKIKIRELREIAQGMFASPIAPAGIRDRASENDNIYRLVASLADFKQEIADRAPDYFTHNGINLVLSPEAASHAADYCRSISDTLGIKISCVANVERLNPVDELFYLQAGDLRGCFDGAEGPGSAAESVRKSFEKYTSARASHNRRAQTAIESFEREQIEFEDGRRLSYYAAGSGPATILIVNAFGQGMEYWKKLIAGLMAEHRVLFWIARGNDHDATGTVESHSLGIHAEDLDHILRNERARECHFVGWCTGPKVILDYYSKRPQKVATMTFLSATFKNVAEFIDLETSYENTLEPLFGMLDSNPGLAPLLLDSLKAVLLAQSQAGTVENGQSADSRELVLEMLRSVNTSLRQAVLEPFSTPEGVVTFGRQLLEFWRYDAMSLLPQVTAPVLFVSGQCDRIASARMAKAVSGKIAGARYLEIRGGSHYLQYDKPELLAEIVNRFVTQKIDFDFKHGLVEMSRSA